MSELGVWRKSSYSANVNQNCVEVAPAWRKSTYSVGGDQSCVEVAQGWRKSSFSGNVNQSCVEAAPLLTRVGVRDTKNRENGHLLVPARQWRVFIGSVKLGSL